jgi:hypothetical protein
MASPKKRVEIRLEAEDYEKVEELSRKLQQPTAQIFREALHLLYSRLLQEERLQAVKNLANLDLKIPAWNKLEKELEGRYEG